MDRYPFLRNVRGLLQVGALGVVILGFVVSVGVGRNNAETTFNLETLSYEQHGFSLASFIVTFIPICISAFSMVVYAELIQLGLDIEEHVYTMRYGQTPGTIMPPGSTPPPNLTPNNPASDNMPPPETKAEPEPERPQKPFDGTLQCLVFVPRTAIIENPRNRYSVVEMALRGSTFTLVGRSADEQWVRIEGSAGHWLSAADLQINGVISDLPVRKT